MTPRSYFVTGTDTGVGKTLITLALQFVTELLRSLLCLVQRLVRDVLTFHRRLLARGVLLRKRRSAQEKTGGDENAAEKGRHRVD